MILVRTSTGKKRSYVMTYRQLSPEERYMLAALRRQGLNQSQIARALGRGTVGGFLVPWVTRDHAVGVEGMEVALLSLVLKHQSPF